MQLSPCIPNSWPLTVQALAAGIGHRSIALGEGPTDGRRTPHGCQDDFSIAWVPGGRNLKSTAAQAVGQNPNQIKSWLITRIHDIQLILAGPHGLLDVPCRLVVEAPTTTDINRLGGLSPGMNAHLDRGSRSSGDDPGRSSSKGHCHGPWGALRPRAASGRHPVRSRRRRCFPVCR